MNLMLRRLLVLVGVIGCLQFCGYRVASWTAALDGHFPSPQPDTRLYCQAAKRVAQGHAFSYSQNEPRCTGTTSVLYPFVLAVPYAMGAKGDRLLEAGFWLNGLFYLIFLFGWTVAFSRWIPGVRGKFLAVALLALSGQPAICAFSQSDTAFWMAVSALLAVALAREKWKWAALLVAVGPWVRPEGMYVVAAMALVALCSRTWRRQLAVPVLLGVMSSLAVFGLNYMLTGRCQFDSIANKGFFKVLPFADACVGIAHDALILFRSYFAGLDENWPRMAFTIPIFGGVFLWLGIFTRDWKARMDITLACLSIAAAFSFAVLSTSMQIGQNFERYLAWTTPLFILFTAMGVVRCCRFAWMRRMRRLLVALVVCFYLGAGVACVMFFQRSSRQSAVVDEYYRAAETAMSAEDCRVARPTTGRVGGYSNAALYDCSDRQFRNLAGIYSPEFFECYRLPLALELLKHRPDMRFEYWQTYALSMQGKISQPDEVFGEELLAGPDGQGIRRADWSAFDRGLKSPVSPEGKSLVATIDVGYLVDEKKAEYEVLDRWGREPYPVFLSAARLDGKPAVDSGRVIIGGDLMTVALEPGRDCQVTVRALSKKDDVSFKSPIRLLVQIDDDDAGAVAYELEDKPEEFQERTFTIPGRFIRQKPCRVAFLGDHIVCGYWFWQ